MVLDRCPGRQLMKSRYWLTPDMDSEDPGTTVRAGFSESSSTPSSCGFGDRLLAEKDTLLAYKHSKILVFNFYTLWLGTNYDTLSPSIGRTW